MEDTDFHSFKEEIESKHKDNVKFTGTEGTDMRIIFSGNKIQISLN